MDEIILEAGPTKPNPYARTFFWLWGAVSLALIGFRADEPTYRQRLETWHQQRLEALRSEHGWLNLAGLFWLKEGRNTAGAGPGSDLAFPIDRAPAQLGTFQLANGVVRFEATPGVAVLADGKPALEPQTIFAPELTKPVTLAAGSLRWFVIKRGERYAVRLRDLNSPLLKQFSGIDRFPADESWRVQAQLEQPAQPRTIPILDVTGQTSQQLLAGTLVFERQGQTYRLDAVREGDNKLFILFGDPTNAHATYGSGRFLYADVPDAAGNVVLDFNQSINPPCAFTAFATCPLPPKQNRLNVAVLAGEKRYGTH